MTAQSKAAAPIVSVRGLKRYFQVKRTKLIEERKMVKAVDGVSFDIPAGSTFGLVGESGCGKSTLGRTLLRLIEPTEGEILFEGEDVMKLSTGQLRERRRDFQIIFQDPYASLNPRMTVGQMIAEPFLIQKMAPKKEAMDKARELLELVGLRANYAGRYAHEFSGGMRQRVSIARALALNPKFVVCDESVSALDVSIQAQIINLMMDLQKKRALTYLFISHDLRVVRSISDHIAVMYLGKMVETGESEALFDNPLHPYTRSLLSAIPASTPATKGRRIILRGDVPSPVNPPAGCRFHTRCQYAKDICMQKEPELRAVDGKQLCACHFAGEL